MTDINVIKLGKPTIETDDIGNQLKKYDFSKELICEVRSISQSEFYIAAQHDYKPEIKVIISDFLDYDGEDKLMFDGEIYDVIRIYRTGISLEIVAERVKNEL